MMIFCLCGLLPAHSYEAFPCDLDNFGNFWKVVSVVATKCCFCCYYKKMQHLLRSEPKKICQSIWPHTIPQLKYWAPKSCGNTGTFAMKLHAHHPLYSWFWDPALYMLNDSVMCLIMRSESDTIYIWLMERTTKMGT